MDRFIDHLVDRTIMGDYGNGEQRKYLLGPLYPIIQNKVNEKLGCPKRHPYSNKINYNINILNNFKKIDGKDFIFFSFYSL